MFPMKDSRDRKIRRDHEDKEARKAYRASIQYDWDDYRPGSQPFAIANQYPKCIFSNATLFKLSHLENKKNYYYNDGIQLEYLDGKFKGKAMKKGKNKGKALKNLCANQNHQKWCNKKNCSEDDVVLVHNYKDNFPFEPDENLPKCQICFHNNSGHGAKYFKDCQHGTMMCSCCARVLWKCPFCRKER